MNRWRVAKRHLAVSFPETGPVQICTKKSNSDA